MNELAAQLDFRQARPGDAKIVAPLIYQAAPRLIDFTLQGLGRSADDYIEHAFRQNIGFYGYQNQYVAEREGKIVMTITLYYGRQFNTLVCQSTMGMLKFFGWRNSVTLTKRMMHIAGLFEKPQKSCLFLANAGVPDNHRGQGMFSTVFRDKILPTLQPGTTHIELDVGIDNPMARKLYERLGFRADKINHYKGKAEIEGVIRMVKPLPAGVVLPSGWTRDTRYLERYRSPGRVD